MFAVSTCASCAEPIPPTSQRCSRCHSRYCGPACQTQHWAAGHKDLCKKIKKRGGAEQYNADNKYKEAVKVEAEECKEFTKGQTCFICMEGAVRRHTTNEGLVGGYCACRGTAGFVHISCLVRQAQIAVEDDMSREDPHERWSRWNTCRLCHQPMRGKVKCALGWACWKTYAGEYNSHNGQCSLNVVQALTGCGLGLRDAGKHTEALAVFQTVLEGSKHAALAHTAHAHFILVAETNLASSFEDLGRHKESLAIRRGLIERTKACHGATSDDTFIDALNLANSLLELKKFDEVKALLPEYVASACATNGPDHRLTLKLRFTLCRARGLVHDGSFEEVVESDKELADIDRRVRRIFGERNAFVDLIKREQLGRKMYHERMANHEEKQEAERERQREEELQKRVVVVMPDPAGGGDMVVTTPDVLKAQGLYKPDLLRAHTYTVAEATAKSGKMKTLDEPAAQPKRVVPAPAPKRAGVDYSKWDNLEDSD